MTYKEITEYFEALSRNNKLVNHSEIEPHFFRVNIDELLVAFKQRFFNPVVFLELPESRITGETLDNAFINRYAALNFLTTVEKGDRSAELTAYDSMEELALQFLARMRYDYSRSAGRLIHRFDWKNVPFFKLGPIHNNMFGIRMEVPIGHWANSFMNYQPNHWKE